MKITELLKKKRPLISFEFFPPKTDEGTRALRETIEKLKALSPDFVSITYGAGGSTRTKTIELVTTIKKEIGLEAAAHLTCVGHNQAEIKLVLDELARSGVENILALRGDPPKGETRFVAAAGGFEYASQLVAFARREFYFSIGVAGYPEKHIEAPTMDEDLKHLKEKVVAGADFIVTQLFFNNADYFRYVEKVRGMGVSIPVIAGIMPVTDLDQIKRFTTMCGASLPTTLLKELEKAGGDKERVAQVGVSHAISQCRELLSHGAPGIHFYTLNKSQSTQAIFLKLKEEKLV